MSGFGVRPRGWVRVTSVVLPWVLGGWLAACTPPPAQSSASASPHLEDQALVDLDGKAYRVGDLLTRNPWTIFVFFSATCPTVAAHDSRLTELWQDVQDQPFSWFMVAPEVGTSIAGLAQEQTRRRYPFPLLWDPKGEVARRLGARYASQVFILGPDAAVAYAGSIDSDRRFLHPDAEPHLRNALVALRHGQTPAVSDKLAYGCALHIER